ncbi:TcfC E-set like domain-containing protein [uncultured Stenotrophomonas sp.]|uniref:TcfC E-set like domain-containing protein n=1 Tax=uncultured Stenotrophomonas sp. TaxID=165438 RepID=UPI0025E0D4BB|nr:TcfC E-set like domain-containing protein [uncultured Stenotrophomonas sp.]
MLPRTARAEAALHTLQQQRERMPAEFREHLFGTPLSVHVELDGTFLGDAQVVLHEDNRLQVLAFGDSYESTLPATERERWAALLAEPTALGTQADAAQGLAALHYSLGNSLVSLLSTDGQRASAEQRYLQVPEQGSTGLILRNSVAYSGGQQQDSALRYSAELQGSLGQWSTQGSYQYYRSRMAGDSDGHYISALHAQREFKDHFLRVGYFLPTFQGVTRQPRAPGSQNYTSVGVMMGSSDVLLADTAYEAVYPVYVTASRDGVVEIHRDGSLIGTQAVSAGMQALDTRRLPGGIYDVELRVVEDGQVSSQEVATIHKPNHWRDPARRWRYSMFAGTQQGLLDSGNDRQHGKVAAGAVVNYLLHPRAVAGASVQRVGTRRSTSASLDWSASDSFNLYTNLYDSSDAGRGVDAQGLFRYAKGSLVASHARSWVEQRNRLAGRDGQPARWQTVGGWQNSSALSINHRLGDGYSLTLRVAHSQGFNAGTSVDASYWRRQRLFNTDASWRLSVYDRPGVAFGSARRQRGIDFTVSVALGEAGRRYNGSVGSRTGTTGRRDLYAGMNVQQHLGEPWVQSVQGTASVDRSGLALAAGAYVDRPQLQGDVQALRAASNGRLSGSANLESTLAVGAGKLAVVGRSQTASADTGMIVDVTSDFPGLSLRADDSRGGGVVLRPGRNFVPVSAYREGHVQFDFNDHHAHTAAIQPSTVRYHLNKGGVMHAQVDVLRTYTVMGQILDADGNGVRGVHVINHASRSVSQDEGFFTLELSARAPVVELRHPDQHRCTLTLDEARYPREGDLVMVGGLQCPPQVAGK